MIHCVKAELCTPCRKPWRSGSTRAWRRRQRCSAWAAAAAAPCQRSRGRASARPAACRSLGTPTARCTCRRRCGRCCACLCYISMPDQARPVCQQIVPVPWLTLSSVKDIVHPCCCCASLCCTTMPCKAQCQQPVYLSRVGTVRRVKAAVPSLQNGGNFGGGGGAYGAPRGPAPPRAPYQQPQPPRQPPPQARHTCKLVPYFAARRSHGCTKPDITTLLGRRLRV